MAKYNFSNPVLNVILLRPYMGSLLYYRNTLQISLRVITPEQLVEMGVPQFIIDAMRAGQMPEADDIPPAPTPHNRTLH